MRGTSHSDFHWDLPFNVVNIQCKDKSVIKKSNCNDYSWKVVKEKVTERKPAVSRSCCLVSSPKWPGFMTQAWRLISFLLVIRKLDISLGLADWTLEFLLVLVSIFLNNMLNPAFLHLMLPSIYLFPTMEDKLLILKHQACTYLPSPIISIKLNNNFWLNQYSMFTLCFLYKCHS